MIDIHTHLLPAVDDGANDLKTSLRQLKIMQDAGVKTVFFTPHFIWQHYDFTQNEVLEKIESLKTATSKENINLELLPGREIYLDSRVIEQIKTTKMNLGNSNYTLVETNMTNFPDNLNENLYQLVRSGLKPILAHPERYSNIIRDPALAEDFLHKNVLLQINAGSLLGFYGKQVQQTAWFLVDNGFAHFLASDNHGNSLQYPLPAACDLIRRRIDDHTVDLLTKINPQKIINNEPITYFYLEKIEKKPSGFFSRFFGSF